MQATVAVKALFSPVEAAEYLGIKAQTLAVWRCTARHSLPYVKVGRRVMYRSSDLAAWAQSRTVAHTGETLCR